MTRFCLLPGLVLLASVSGFASGPGDRVATDPKSVVSAESAAGASPMPVAELLQTVRLAGSTWSPDGKQIGYISNASGRLNLWVMQADGTGARQLLKSNDRQSSPAFTKDGKEIVFEQDKGGDELYDLYAVSVGGGEPKNLTNTDKTSESGPLFSKDGKWLAFGSKEKVESSTNLAVMEWPAGTARLLTHEKDPKASWDAVDWSPDGRYVYAVRQVGTEDADVYRVEVKSGAAENLTAHTGKVLMLASAVSPDGKTLLMTSNEKGGYANVALLDVASKKRRWVTDTQWEAHAGGFSPRGDTFTYILNADGRATINFVDGKTLKASDRGVPAGLNTPGAGPTAFREDGSYLFSHQDSTHAPNLYLLSAGGTVTQVTHNESPVLTSATLPSSQLVTYKSFDGKMISALVWVPFNLKRDGTAPVVVMPHGGPTGQTLDSFSPRAILLVSRGYVVIAPNVRGSTGYGMEFQKANYKDLGGADLKDEIAGVDFLKATGFVDAKKVGIWGGSYGGFMTLMAIGKNPEMWAAAVDEYGILDWYTMLAHEDAQLQEYEKSLLGDPVVDKAVYEASSPLKYIREEKAPLLVLQGERDIRVPKEEAEQVVEILKKEGRTVDAVYYPEEGHGFIKREHQVDELTRSVGWFDKYLKGETKAQ
ncbi:S9 family peptidase [Tunturiibacter gelidoferens]|uniref:Dipeptidyl aminopeptidase/acylaminoacyl peptidase n=1 Tax=Tunturiibacter gelidiferens TaxID=3069689 RepID=A0ACC5P242_9BACT|nr:S9 family peptidase [Edaphobacter lichenicola]MBB5340882.1 dipeptidyl aminopeptidase/acylaminoacyl peptidase [Edaphobacter lichenicola]